MAHLFGTLPGSTAHVPHYKARFRQSADVTLFLPPQARLWRETSQRVSMATREPLSEGETHVLTHPTPGHFGGSSNMAMKSVLEGRKTDSGCWAWSAITE
uniref:Zinc finger protein 473 n=1 Tax=Myotis myotis TaxID=51298 RepID=A0A7J7QY42_MYOMY|nr:zinc finger protein 473 [Myotis myotis]